MAQLLYESRSMAIIDLLGELAKRARRAGACLLEVGDVVVRASQIVAVFLFAASGLALVMGKLRGNRRAGQPGKRKSESLARFVDTRRFREALGAELERVSARSGRCSVLVVAPRGVASTDDARAAMAWAVVGACSSRDVVTCLDAAAPRYAVLLCDAPASAARFLAGRIDRALGAAATLAEHEPLAVATGVAEAHPMKPSTPAGLLEAAMRAMPTTRRPQRPAA